MLLNRESADAEHPQPAKSAETTVFFCKKKKSNQIDKSEKCLTLFEVTFSGRKKVTLKMIVSSSIARVSVHCLIWLTILKSHQVTRHALLSVIQYI